VNPIHPLKGMHGIISRSHRFITLGEWGIVIQNSSKREASKHWGSLICEKHQGCLIYLFGGQHFVGVVYWCDQNKLLKPKIVDFESLILVLESR
jgi:hypothetical protein